MRLKSSLCAFASLRQKWFQGIPDLFPAAEIKAQRRIRQMRVIILRPWTNDRAFVVVVILIANIPIEPVVQLDSKSCFRRLKTHRVRCDQRSRIPGWICQSIPLPIVFVNSISGKQRHSRSNAGHRLDKEKVVSHVVQAMS